MKNKWDLNNGVAIKRWFKTNIRATELRKEKALLPKTGCLYHNCYVVDKKEYIFGKKLVGLFASIKKGFTFAIR